MRDGVFRGVRSFARRGPNRKHSFPSSVACIRVYRAVAWERVNHIRCNIYVYIPHVCHIKIFVARPKYAHEQKYVRRIC
jgi:hypothetical protein